MRGGIKVKELMRRDDLTGEVVNLFPSRHTGIIHGDDGYDVTFSDDSLIVGFGYSKLSVGSQVCYGFFFATGAKVLAAINVQPARANHPEQSDGLNEEKCGTRACAIWL